MKLKSIQIRGLFEIFDYDIAFPQDENVLIITGPNGYGKTMILNIIFNLFTENFEFFDTLPFSAIELKFDAELVVKIVKMKIDENSANDSTGITFFNRTDEIGRLRTKTQELVFGEQKTETFVRDPYFEEAQKVHQSQLPLEFQQLDVYLIREQRLFQTVFKKPFSLGQARDIVENSIKLHADKLKNIMKSIDGIYSEFSQKLDSSYIARLRNEIEILNEEEWLARYRQLQEKQEKLSRYDLYEVKMEPMQYSAEDAKALTVYLKDVEKKVGLFDFLLQKLDLFTEILNERRFTFKKVCINREKGFYFQTATGRGREKEIELSQLSSGEQHEVILLFELIFNVLENTLVLIDEPEISLHISWQKEFLQDLQRIIALQKMQVIIATHAPAIINGRWDLAYNLAKAVA